MLSNKVNQFQRDPCLVPVARKLLVILYLCLKKGCLSRTEFVIQSKLLVMRWMKKLQEMRMEAPRLAKQRSTLKSLVVGEVGDHSEKGPMTRTNLPKEFNPEEKFSGYKSRTTRPAIAEDD